MLHHQPFSAALHDCSVIHVRHYCTSYQKLFMNRNGRPLVGKEQSPYSSDRFPYLEEESTSNQSDDTSTAAGHLACAAGVWLHRWRSAGRSNRLASLGDWLTLSWSASWWLSSASWHLDLTLVRSLALHWTRNLHVQLTSLIWVMTRPVVAAGCSGETGVVTAAGGCSTLGCWAGGCAGWLGAGT